MMMTAVTRPLQLPQGAAQGFKLALIRVPLALEAFQQLQNLVHLFEALFERIDNLVYLLNGLFDVAFRRGLATTCGR